MLSQVEVRLDSRPVASPPMTSGANCGPNFDIS